MTATTWATHVESRKYLNRALKVAAAALLAAAALFGHTLGDAPPAAADPGCETVPWGFIGLGQRTICDGPIRSDGSWQRARGFWYPAYQVPLSCSGSRYFTSCWGGYWVPEEKRIETYIVTPDTVLADEPGHLASTDGT